MERKYNVAVTLEERIKEANKLIDNTPDGYIVDADTLLCDAMEKADFEVTGLAKDIFNIWLNSSDRASVEAVFYDLTDMQLDEFVELCLEKMSRETEKDVQYAVIASCDRELWIVGTCDSKEEAFALMKNDFLKTLRENYHTDDINPEDYEDDDGDVFLGENHAYANFRVNCDWKIERLKG